NPTSGTLGLGTANTSAISLGNVSDNTNFTFNGSGTFQTSTGTNTLGGNVSISGSTVSLANAASSTIQTTGANTGLTLLSNGSGNITLGQSTGNGTVVI